MFGLTSLKMILFGGAFLIIVSAIGGGVYYITNIINENEILTENNETLNETINDQKIIIENIKKDMVFITTQLDGIQKLERRLNDELRDIDKKIEDSRLESIALKKANLLKNVINNASKNAIRCLEIASGSNLTEDEMNATKKSEINSECSDIANPNYVD